MPCIRAFVRALSGAENNSVMFWGFFFVEFSALCCPVWHHCCLLDGEARSLAACRHRTILNCKLLKAFSVTELIVSEQTLLRQIGALQVVKR